MKVIAFEWYFGRVDLDLTVVRDCKTRFELFVYGTPIFECLNLEQFYRYTNSMKFVLAS